MRWRLKHGTRWSYWHDRLENGAVMTVSEHGGSMAMARRHGAALCSGAGERRARRESEMERAAEVHGLSFRTGLPGRADASVRLPCGTHGLTRSATAASKFESTRADLG